MRFYQAPSCPQAQTMVFLHAAEPLTCPCTNCEAAIVDHCLTAMQSFVTACQEDVVVSALHRDVRGMSIKLSVGCIGLRNPARCSGIHRRI